MLIKSGMLVIDKIIWDKEDAKDNGVDIRELPKRIDPYEISEADEWDDDESDLGMYDELYEEYGCAVKELKYHYEDVVYVDDMRKGEW